MSKCEDIQIELEAYLSGETDEHRKNEIRHHLKDCRDCSQALQKLTKLSGVLDIWQTPEPSPLMYEQLKAQMKTRAPSGAKIFIRRVAFKLTEIAAIVAITLLMSHWLKFPQSWVPEKPAPQTRDESTSINFYLKEHQDIIAQTASANISPPPAAQMHVNRHDVLYYEFMDDPYEFARPGIIVRGPSHEKPTSPPQVPAIANGHTLTLSEARETADFDIVAPSWLHPYYKLDQIRRIEGRDAMQLLYTNGINSISLFEQPLNGRRGLEPKDFREYAVYQNKGQVGGTILAWRDETLSYVLIGSAEMSQLMDMAQYISAAR